MKPIVRYRQEALDDLTEIWLYIGRDSRRQADLVLPEIDNDARMLSEFPEAGRQRDDLAPGLRSWPVRNYLIFYRPAEDGIDVIRVVHGRRDIRPHMFGG